MPSLNRFFLLVSCATGAEGRVLEEALK